MKLNGMIDPGTRKNIDLNVILTGWYGYPSQQSYYSGRDTDTTRAYAICEYEYYITAVTTVLMEFKKPEGDLSSQRNLSKKRILPRFSVTWSCYRLDGWCKFELVSTWRLRCCFKMFYGGQTLLLELLFVSAEPVKRPQRCGRRCKRNWLWKSLQG